MKKFSAIVLMCFCLVVAKAQTGGTGKMDPEKMPKIGVLSGVIIDQQTNQKVQFANVVLYSANDSSIVAGSITDEKGYFILQNLPVGRHYLEANFIGYEKSIINDIRITPKSPEMDLGKIMLSEAVQQLEGVEIEAKRDPVSYQVDRKVIDVSQNLAAKGSNVVEALTNIPSITVDIEGNVSLRGSSSFLVLIDGRPSPLKGSDALRQLPADMVENVEIITNPSAKYDPDGVSGIINVVTKKNKYSGLTGIVSAGTGNREKYQVDALLSYRLKKFNIFGGINANNSNRTGTSTMYQERSNNDTLYYTNNEGSRDRVRKGYSFKAGADYFLNSSTTLSLSGSAGHYEFGGLSDSRTHKYSFPANANEMFYTTYEDGGRFGDYWNSTLSFQKKFEGNGHVLDAFLNYESSTGSSDDLREEFLTNEGWQVIDPMAAISRTIETGKDSEIRFQADYVRPMGEGSKLETGYQLRMDTDSEDYLYEQRDWGETDMVEINNNSMDFYRNIQAVYGTFSQKLKSFEYQLGIRGEYTNRYLEHEQSDDDYRINRFDYFPTIHLSKALTKKDQLQLSYSRRIERPRGYSLEPFPNVMDRENIRIGNPNLAPEYINSYEIGYQHRFEVAFISAEGYLRQTNDLITRVLKYDSAAGISYHTFDNFNDDYSLGVELMVNTPIGEKLSLNVSGNIYKYWLEGEVDGEDINRSSTNYDMRGMLQWKATKTTNVQLNGFYRGPSVTTQGTTSSFFVTSMAVKQELFKKKLTATLSVRDLLGTMQHKQTRELPGLYHQSLNKMDPYSFSLNLSYNINNFRDKSKGRGEGGGGEMGGDDDF